MLFQFGPLEINARLSSGPLLGEQRALVLGRVLLRKYCVRGEKKHTPVFIKWGQIIRRKLITNFLKGVIKRIHPNDSTRTSNRLPLPWESTSHPFGGSGRLSVMLLYKSFLPFLLSVLANVISGFSSRALSSGVFPIKQTLNLGMLLAGMLLCN